MWVVEVVRFCVIVLLLLYDRMFHRVHSVRRPTNALLHSRDFPVNGTMPLQRKGFLACAIVAKFRDDNLKIRL